MMATQVAATAVLDRVRDDEAAEADEAEDILDSAFSSSDRNHVKSLSETTWHLFLQWHII